MNEKEILNKEDALLIKTYVFFNDLEQIKKILQGKYDSANLLDKSFMSACTEGKVDIIKYLLTSKDFSPNPNSVRAIAMMFAHKREEAINWLIFDYNVKKDGAIEEVLIELSDKEYAKHISRLFDLRKLRKDSDDNLKKSSTNHNKRKI